MYRVLLGQNFKHLLLAVASGLADDEVARLHIGTGAPQLESERRLDQSTGIARQYFFGNGYGKLGSCAEADGDGPGRPAEFLRDENAIGGHHLAAFFGMLS
jgi:hypothetical protein